MNALSRRRFLMTTLGVGMTVGATACARKKEPVKVGAVLPLTGPLELFGNQAKLGLDLAVNEINGAGGILGNRLEMLYEDNKGDAQTTWNKAVKLAQQHEVLAIVGPITSSAREAITDGPWRLKTPLLYATTYEGGACGRYVFSFSTVPNQELDELLPHIQRTAGRSYYMFGAAYIWPVRMFETAKQIIANLGGRVKAVEYTRWGVKDFEPVIRRIMASGARVLIFALPGSDGINFIRQAEALGLHKRVTVVFLGFFEGYLDAFGSDSGWRIWVAVPMVSSSDEPAIQDFVTRARSIAGEEATVSHFVLTHYNALMALKAGLEKTGRIDREAVIEGLEGLSFESPTGHVSIDADHHHATLSMYLASVEGANLKEIRALGHLASRPGCRGAI